MDRERAIDELYAQPPEEFVAARNELARALRAKGEGEAADAVKRLRRPSHAAAIVNRLAREEPELVEALLGAGGELRQAHRQAAAGRGGTRLRDAAEAERQAVDQLVARARAVEPRPVLLERVRDTLHAAASDDAVRAELAAGRLTDDARAATLGPLSAARPPGRAKAKKTPAKPSREAAGQRRSLEAQLRRARAEERRLRKLTDEAARALGKAEARHARTRAAADAAEEAAANAAQAVADHRERLERAAAAQHEAASFIARLEAEARAG